jgi:hypothetical protein
MPGSESGSFVPPSDLAAVIERTAADLGLAEEPAHFILALEGDHEPPPSPSPGLICD